MIAGAKFVSVSSSKARLISVCSWRRCDSASGRPTSADRDKEARIPLEAGDGDDGVDADNDDDAGGAADDAENEDVVVEVNADNAGEEEGSETEESDDGAEDDGDEDDEDDWYREES